MFTSKALLAGAVLIIAVAMTTFPSEVAADRSFYAPMPVNYPGLLPRFGGGIGDTSRGSTGGGGRGSSDDLLGTRFGGNDDDRDQRRRPSTATVSGSRQSTGCTQRVPCYDCIVYISRTGQITRYNPSRQNEIVRY